MKNEEDKDLQSTRAAQSGSVGYVTVPNAMPASRDAAPYLGQTHVGGSYTQSDVAKRIASSKGCQIGKDEVVRVWNATGNYLLDRMPEEPCSYDLGFVRIRPSIGGRFPSMDAAFDPSRNRLYVAVVPSSNIRNALGDSAPTRDGEIDGEPEIGNVMWGGKSQTIKSGEPFDVLGNALTLDDGDYSAELSLPAGTSVPVTLVAKTPGNWQRLVGRLANAVEACEGAVLIIRTHGYDMDSGLRTVMSKRLTVLAGESPSNPPHITSGHSESHADDGKCYADGSGFVLEGDNLEDALVTIAGSANEGESWSYVETIPAEKVNFDADMLTIDGNWLDSWYNHMDVGELVKFTVETTQGEDSVTRTLSA